MNENHNSCDSKDLHRNNKGASRKGKRKNAKKRYTKEDWLREARAFLEKTGRKEKLILVK